jgi:hypothetical protein
MTIGDPAEVQRLFRLFSDAMRTAPPEENVRGTAVGMLVGSLCLMNSDPEAAFNAIGTVAGQIIARFLDTTGTMH